MFFFTTVVCWVRVSGNVTARDTINPQIDSGQQHMWRL